MSSDILTWHPISNNLVRRGNDNQVGNFYEFAPGAVQPLGYADEALGIGARNVGPRISSFTPYYGDYTLTPGAQVIGLEIFGRLIGRGNAATVVRDCIIHGSATVSTSQSALAVGTSYNFGGAKFEWCRFDLTGNEGSFSDIINGGNYTMRYSEVTRGVDGVGSNVIGNATIHCCRIWGGHYTSWWDDDNNRVRTASYQDADGVVHNPPFPGQASGDVHADGVQIQQYSGWVIRGCYIGGNRGTVAANHLDPTVPADLALIKLLDADTEFRNAAIIISSASGANPVGATIENNWLAGGAARFNIAWKAYDDMSGIILRNNRFVRTNYGYYMYVQNNCAATFSGNVFDDDNTAVPIVNWG